MSASMIDPYTLAVGEKMLKAIAAGDYPGFIEAGSARFKTETTKEEFQSILDQIAPRMKRGYQFSFVVERPRPVTKPGEKQRVFLWKIKFEDGEGDFDFYLNCEDGRVDSIRCQMVWPVEGLAYVAMWMGPLFAGPIFCGQMCRAGGWSVLFSLLVGLAVGAAIMFGNGWMMHRIVEPWLEKHQARLLKKPAVIFVNIAAFVWAILITALAGLISIYLLIKIYY
jgi:hypothetical protein